MNTDNKRIAELEQEIKALKDKAKADRRLKLSLMISQITIGMSYEEMREFAEVFNERLQKQYAYEDPSDEHG